MHRTIVMNNIKKTLYSIKNNSNILKRKALTNNESNKLYEKNLIQENWTVYKNRPLLKKKGNLYDFLEIEKKNK